MDRYEVAALDSETSPGVVAGFDLDGRESDSFDPCGCFQADLRSGPPDHIEGVDSETGNLLATLGLTAQLNTDIERTLADGSFLYLFAVRGVDSFENDDCVTVDLLRGRLRDGMAEPELTDGGRFVEGQQFAVDPATLEMDGTPVARFDAGRIVDGRLTAGGANMWDLFLFVDDAWFQVRHHSPRIAFDIAATGLSQGMIGGAAGVEETIELNPEAIMTWESVTEILMRAVLQAEADLIREGGRCQYISVGHSFAATQAAEPVFP
jgi:hypothetical protein